MKNILKKIIIPVITWQAMHLLGRFRPKIIAITGSVGKTSTKEAIYHFLKDEYTVRKSQKSFNSEIGVPLTILGLSTGWTNPVKWSLNIVKGFFTSFFSRDYPEVLVLEVGADKPGDIGETVRWVKPSIAVVTALPDVPVHVENFPSIEAVYEEKLKLLKALPKEGKAVINADDHRLVSKVKELSLDPITFSTKSEFFSKLSVPEFANPYPVLAGATVAKLLGIPEEKIISFSRTLKTSPGRMNKLEGLNGSTLIDDTYNSSPVAALSALETLKKAEGYKRKIAVLGDMRELGEYAEQEHRNVGKVAAQIADIVIAVGDQAEWLADEAEKSGMTEDKVIDCRNSIDAGEYLKKIIQPGDLVLIKGSQGVRMEHTVRAVLADPETQMPLLVRTDKEWQKR